MSVPQGGHFVEIKVRFKSLSKYYQLNSNYLLIITWCLRKIIIQFSLCNVMEVCGITRIMLLLNKKTLFWWKIQRFFCNLIIVQLYLFYNTNFFNRRITGIPCAIYKYSTMKIIRFSYESPVILLIFAV